MDQQANARDNRQACRFQRHSRLNREQAHQGSEPVMVQELRCSAVVAALKLKFCKIVEGINLQGPNLVLLLQELQVVCLVLSELLHLGLI
jgi:hypothetical protein